MGFFARRQFKGIEVVRIIDDARGFAPHFHDEFVLSVNVQDWSGSGWTDGISMPPRAT